MTDALLKRLAALSDLTPSRVRLDAGGGPLPLERLMRFQEDHAAARDAIYTPFDTAALRAALDEDRKGEIATVHSRAATRAEYLKRPDLGRKLALDTTLTRTAPPFAIVVADGLSAPAVTTHVRPLLAALAETYPPSAHAPVFLASQARVAIGDDIGAAIGAQMVLVLIGERPGLTVSDSLGAYLTWAPATGIRDSARNCVSNIHANGGLPYRSAAARLAWLIEQASVRRLTGVNLKDESSEKPLLE